MSFTPAVALGAAAISPLVHDLGACLIAAALLAVLFERVRIPTIAAPPGARVVAAAERRPTGRHFGTGLAACRRA